MKLRYHHIWIWKVSPKMALRHCPKWNIWHRPCCFGLVLFWTYYTISSEWNDATVQVMVLQFLAFKVVFIFFILFIYFYRYNIIWIYDIFFMIIIFGLSIKILISFWYRRDLNLILLFDDKRHYQSN